MTDFNVTRRSFLCSAAVAAAVAGLSLTSCNGSENTGNDSSSTPDASDKIVAEGTSEETLNVACDGEPNSLLPNYAQNKTANRVIGSMFNYLVHWNHDEQKAEPSLATSWEWDDDTHITFTLRDDVEFSDGSKFTAHDVTVSLKTSTENTISSYSSMFDIPNFREIDDTHIQIALVRPYGNLLDILGCEYYAIFSSTAFEAQGSSAEAFSRNPVASGPYVLKEWKQGESITLERNENYWDEGNLPYYKTIVYTFIADASSRVTALQSGQVSIAYNLAPSQVETLKSAGTITVNCFNQNVAVPVQFNMRTVKALANEDVRKAIVLGMDKKAIADARYAGYADVSGSPLLVPASPYYKETDPSQDVEKAKQLIANCGLSSDELTFDVIAISGEATSYIEIFQAEMREIGVTINVVTYDLPTMLQKLRNNETMIGFGEIDTWDPSRMLDVLDSRVTTPIANNCYVGEGEDELHDLIDMAENAADDNERKDALASIQEFCSEHAALTVISSVMIPDAWSSNLTGIEYDAHQWPQIWNVRPYKD